MWTWNSQWPKAAAAGGRQSGEQAVLTSTWVCRTLVPGGQAPNLTAREGSSICLPWGKGPTEGAWVRSSALTLLSKSHPFVPDLCSLSSLCSRSREIGASGGDSSHHSWTPLSGWDELRAGGAWALSLTARWVQDSWLRLWQWGVRWNTSHPACLLMVQLDSLCNWFRFPVSLRLSTGRRDRPLKSYFKITEAKGDRDLVPKAIASGWVCETLQSLPVSAVTFSATFGKFFVFLDRGRNV